MNWKFFGGRGRGAEEGGAGWGVPNGSLRPGRQKPLLRPCVTGLPWTPNGVGSPGPRGYCIFLPGVHYLTINSPYGADSSLNILLLLLLPTHDDGHTLDLLITRTNFDIIIHLSHHVSYQSDHKSFTFEVLSSFHTFVQPLNDLSFNTALSNPSKLTISNLTFSLLFTQIQLLILLIYLNSSHQPSIPYSTSMPHSNQKLLSLDPIHHGFIPKFLWLNRREVDSNDHGVAGNLPLTARNSEPNAILSDL